MGEIVARSDLLMKGYWCHPAATSETLKRDCLHTGDIRYNNEKGYLILRDRFKDMVIHGGEDIYARKIEEVIVQHPVVR